MRPVVVQAAVLALLALPPAALTAVAHPRRPAPAAALAADEIDAATAAGWRNALWLDARSPERFVQAHVPGALSVPVGEDPFAALASAWDGSSPIVVYCDPGCDASRDLAERLRAQTDATRVYVLHDGWNAWQTYAAH